MIHVQASLELGKIPRERPRLAQKRGVWSSIRLLPQESCHALILSAARPARAKRRGHRDSSRDGLEQIVLDSCLEESSWSCRPWTGTRQLQSGKEPGDLEHASNGDQKSVHLMSSRLAACSSSLRGYRRIGCVHL